MVSLASPGSGLRLMPRSGWLAEKVSSERGKHVPHQIQRGESLAHAVSGMDCHRILLAARVTVR